MIVENLLRENIKNIKPYSSARDEYKEVSGDMVFLDANENPFPSTVNRYPDPQQLQLRKRLSELKGVPESKILLGNGSDEVLDLLFRAFCEPNEDNVVILPPTYGMYSVLAALNAVQTKEVYLTKNYQLDIESILKGQNENSKLLFICSPNNPTANSFEATKIEHLLRSFNGIVVIDEAYIDFSTENSWLQRLEDFPNLVVTQTLSKAYGMAGIRLGICYASEFIISVLNKIKPPYNVNELSQQKALERLHKISEVNVQVNHIIEQREKLKHAFKNMKFVKEVYNTDANFILVKVDDANLRYNQLIEKGIVVRNRTSQPLCENCLRFTVGTLEENTRLIDTLNKL